jgi:hypothetical protein
MIIHPMVEKTNKIMAIENDAVLVFHRVRLNSLLND